MDDLISRREAIDALKQQAETMSEWSNRYAEQKKGVLTAVNIVEDLPTAQRWIPCSERLPEKSGSYLTYLHEPLNFDDDECDWGYVTEMHFDMWQMLWNDNNVSYNAVLSAVYKDGEYFVSHWMPLPEPPKEET